MTLGLGRLDKAAGTQNRNRMIGSGHPHLLLVAHESRLGKEMGKERSAKVHRFEGQSMGHIVAELVNTVPVAHEIGGATAPRHEQRRRIGALVEHAPDDERQIGPVEQASADLIDKERPRC
jgi:hypothetical protein